MFGLSRLNQLKLAKYLANEEVGVGKALLANNVKRVHLQCFRLTMFPV
jgi:hypothetical protein